jgi:kynurenine formamidase
MRIVDLTAVIEPSPPGTPEFQRTDVEYLDHAGGAAEVEALFGVPARLLRDGEGWTRETVTIGTHNATHLDAPSLQLHDPGSAGADHRAAPARALLRAGGRRRGVRPR